MCGIVGLFCKSDAMADNLGEHLSRMLVHMNDRGPDSAFGAPGSGLADAFGGEPEVSRRVTHAVLVVAADAADAQAYVRAHHPEVRVMSVGSVIEIYKETGLPSVFAEQFSLGDIRGTHALGHTRMATESRVTTLGSHPFSTGLDVCLVHNGSLSNHNRLRERLRRQGMRVDTENDTEVA